MYAGYAPFPQLVPGYVVSFSSLPHYLLKMEKLAARWAHRAAQISMDSRLANGPDKMQLFAIETPEMLLKSAISCVEIARDYNALSQLQMPAEEVCGELHAAVLFDYGRVLEVRRIYRLLCRHF